MEAFPVHTVESAPEQSKPSLQALQGAFGMIPNLVGAMSTSPALISSLVGLFQKVHGGSFSEDQIQILLLTNSAAPRFFNCFIDMSARPAPRNMLHLIFDPPVIVKCVDQYVSRALRR